MQLSLFDSNSERTLRQEENVDNWVKNKCCGTILACTGYGKTNVGLIAIRRFQKRNPKHKIIVAVPSDAIRIQWMKELDSRGLIAEVHTYHETSKQKFKCGLLILDE